MRIQAALKALTRKLGAFNGSTDKFASKMKKEVTKAKGGLSQIRGEWLAASDLDLAVYRKSNTPGPMGKVPSPLPKFDQFALAGEGLIPPTLLLRSRPLFPDL